MRILTIGFGHRRYGSENHMLRIAIGAAQHGFDVHAAFPKAPGTSSMVRDCEAHNIAYSHLEVNLQVRSKLQYLRSVWQMTRFLRAVRPNLVQLMLAWPTEILVPSVACSAAGIPLLAVFQLAPRELNLTGRQRRVLRWARSRRQRWMAVSEHNSFYLQKTFMADESEFGILPNGIEISEIPTKEEIAAARRKVRSEIGLPSDAKILLTMARLDRQKGHADLLQIAARLVDKFPDVVLVWVGEGNQQLALEAQVRAHGYQRHVKFLGYRTDVDNLLRASDLFVLPTRFEGGCSSSIREAMVNCLPIVCSDAGGIPEVLTHDVHALLFPVGDIEGMFGRLAYALSSPEQLRVLADRARERIEEFSSERMLRDYFALFEELNSDRSLDGDGLTKPFRGAA